MLSFLLNRYDDPQSVMAKMNYIKQHNLAGSMWWSIDTEDFSNLCGQGKYPLLRIAKAMMMEEEDELDGQEYVDNNEVQEFEEVFGAEKERLDAPEYNENEVHEVDVPEYFEHEVQDDQDNEIVEEDMLDLMIKIKDFQY